MVDSRLFISDTCQFIEIQNNDDVLDLCAAPGKTAQLISLEQKLHL